MDSKMREYLKWMEMPVSRLDRSSQGCIWTDLGTLLLAVFLEHKVGRDPRLIHQSQSGAWADIELASLLSFTNVPKRWPSVLEMHSSTSYPDAHRDKLITISVSLPLSSISTEPVVATRKTTDPGIPPVLESRGCHTYIFHSTLWRWLVFPVCRLVPRCFRSSIWGIASIAGLDQVIVHINNLLG